MAHRSKDDYSEKTPATLQELPASPQTMRFIEKGIITEQEVLAEDFRGAGGVSTDAQSYGAMTNDIGLLLLEAATLKVIVVAALAMFMLRRLVF